MVLDLRFLIEMLTLGESDFVYIIITILEKGGIQVS